MLKMIALMRRKSGTTLEQFREYYETRHAPLAMSFFNFERYERNFIVPESLGGGKDEAVPSFPYDVVTQMWFRDRADYDRMIEDVRTSDKGDRLKADEENFLDRSSITVFLVEQAQS